MKIALVSFVVVGFLTAAANGQGIKLLIPGMPPDVPLLPKEYTILCEADQSVGFDWLKGDWVVTNFKPKKRIITKSETNLCRPQKFEDENYTTWVSRNDCLNVRDFGTPYTNRGSSYCSVDYTKDDTGWETRITCDDPKMVLKVDGRYHLAYIHNNLYDRPPNANVSKDSMYVEVGKCARIK